MDLITLLRIAGLLHLVLLCAGITMPRAVKLPAHLATLPVFIRQLFWVYYVFIGTTIVGFGSITFFCAPELAAGGPLARGLCALMAIFWTMRLVVAVFVFDVRPYLTNRFYVIGHWGLNIVFGFLPVIYVWAALKGVRL